MAKRAIVLCAVAARGEGIDWQEAIGMLDERGIWEATAPEERGFLLKKDPDRQQMVNFTWKYESLWVLLQALGHVEELSIPTSICDAQRAVGVVLNSPPEKFIQQAKNRSLFEILDEADLIYRYYWAVVNAQINGETPPMNLHPGVIYDAIML